MKYSFVNSQGFIEQTKDFGNEIPPTLPVKKGRWLPNVPPSFDSRYQTLIINMPIGIEQTTIPYTIISISLDDAIKKKHEEINQWKMIEAAKGFSWNGHEWDSDVHSVVMITTVTLSGQTSPTGYWTDKNNIDVPVTVMDMQGMFASMVAKGGAIHARQRNMKKQVSAMTNVADVINFVPSW